jgi:hypothetical protein
MNGINVACKSWHKAPASDTADQLEQARKALIANDSFQERWKAAACAAAGVPLPIYGE